MKSAILLSCLSSLAFACSPKNDEVTTEQLDRDSVEVVSDSLANTRKDAVQTEENSETLNFPLPQPVFDLVSDKYPNWKEPVFTENVLQESKSHTQGPATVRGDFNGDNQQDYAMQLQQNSQVVIVAIMGGNNGNWQIHELKKDILFNDRGNLKSPYLLSLAEKGKELQHTETRKETEAPYNTVSLNLDGEETTYLYQNGRFEAYNSKN